MGLIRFLAVTGVAALATGLSGGTQQRQDQPSIDFGGARVSLGMTVEQVEKNLAESGRQLRFLADKNTALVRISSIPEPRGHEGQVTFAGGRAAYVSFHFPDARDANELAQELAGAAEAMDTKVCTVGNYNGHGTGGGYAETIFDCDSKSFQVWSVETLGSSDRYTHVEITMGEIPRSK